MNQNILQTLFLNNPEIPGEIADFCNSIPEYVQAERECSLAFRELEKILGYDQCSHLEEVVNRQLSLEVRAYYLFGLGLRKQVLSGLGV